jgi:hypothetical protein
MSGLDGQHRPSCYLNIKRISTRCYDCEYIIACWKAKTIRKIRRRKR